MKRTIAIGALLATICGLVYYLALPAMTFTNAGFWWYVLLCLVCAATTLSVYYFCEDEGWIPMLVAWITTGVFFVAFVICAIISWRAFQWKNAQAIAQVEEAQVSIQEVFDDLATSNAVDELPLIDYDTAKMLSDKQIAGLNHAEWYDVDDQCNLINYQGKYYRISLVDYGELFKFGKAKKTGLPGYVLVDVTPVEGKVTQSANLVKLEESVQYSPGAFWSHDLRRHLRGQYVSYVFDESHIEIDDEGTPYWITGVMRPTGGVWGARSITSVILTNAQTGDSQEYRLEELPEWVDSAFSIGYLMKIAEWHYALRDGWWNASFSQTNVWRTSY